MFLLSSPNPLPASSNRLPVGLAALFFLVLALGFYVPSLGWLPRGIHEWAQADRLALAISFYDHGMHFFRPQTLNLGSVDGVVGVEFPLIPYLAALGAKLTGRESIVVWFRSLNVVLAGLGGFYLFRLVFERTRQFAAALLPGVFLATSPVFAYYAGNFLPDPVGASLALVGAYYFLGFGRVPRFGHLVAAIGLFTLATLIKTSAGIYLVAALGTVLLWSYLHPSLLTLRQKLVFIVMAASSLGVVVGYALFNRYLNDQYHSNLFLAQVMPIETPQQYEAIMTRIQLLWQFEYFTAVQYGVLVASLVVCLVGLYWMVRTEWLWLSQLALASLGGWLFFRLMGTQFLDHDYYVLAPFWPGLALLVALATVQAANWRLVPVLARHVVFGIGVAALLIPGFRQQRARLAEPYKHFSDYYTYHWMEGGAAAIAAYVPPSDHLLVLGEMAPNLALVYFDRRGLAWQPDVSRMPLAELVERMHANGLDCVVMRKGIFEELQRTHADVFSPFKQVVSTPQFTALRLRNNPPHW